MTTVAARRWLTAETVMSAPVVTVSPDASPWEAWTAMARHGIRHLVVTIDGRCVGVLDDREIFAQWPMGPLALRRSHIGSIMRTRTAVVLPETDLRTVARVMNDDRVDAVPVVDPAGNILGVVTAGDILSAVSRYGVCAQEDIDPCEW